jgi:glucose-6-phosphate isomerase
VQEEQGLMAGTIRFDYGKAAPFVTAGELEAMAPSVAAAHRMLHEKTGPGSDYLGWVDLPDAYDRAEYSRIREAAARIREQADALVVIGIGGSYLGARAAIEALTHTFHNLLPHERRRGVRVFWAGHHISPTYLTQLIEALDGSDLAVNVISKSGTTTEPALAFRFLGAHLERRYGKEEARRRIYVTTDRQHGALRRLASAEGYESFVIPADIGGRFSVLTAVGLLPIASAGVDTDALLEGAAAARAAYAVPDLTLNPAYQYAAARNLLYRKGKAIELFVSYEPHLQYLGEWWKQLFGESEGKDGKGLFPAAAGFSTELHSLGQYIQDGHRHLVETVLAATYPQHDIMVEPEPGDGDGLNFMAGRTMDYVNRKALEGTLIAHADGGVPNLLIRASDLTGRSFGELLYFFQKACGISGHLLGVNPFDQPGVEAYKRNMFALLGKPGFEAERERLEARLHK